ncbi:ABC transporter substrate-binding protein [Balneolaceae bacterium ANBcel3]|nr:ABC transporter substrate-binding protein [Balneolaceae bacterium ANBcel3]
MSKLFLILFLFLAGTTSELAFAQSPEQEVRSILEERDRQIKDLLGDRNSDYTEEQREKLRGIVNDMMDYKSMGKYALDATYQELTREEQEEFIDLFSKIIRDQSLQQLDIYRAEVIYDQITVDENRAKVTTTAILDNNRVPVLYRMEQMDGEWVIIDMSVDNAWTAESYRRSFQNIIRRRGFDALMENLRRRAGQV